MSSLGQTHAEKIVPARFFAAAVSPPRSCAALPSSEFRRRVEEELPHLRRAARYWQREKAAAEDLLQDTVLRALANAHQFEAGSNLRAWLLAIMRNRFLAAAAASARWMPMLDGSTKTDAEAAAHPSEGRLLLRDLGRALGRLPEKQRTVVLAIGVHEKSYEEVAHAMGTSVAAVRCHLARARDRLRAAIEGGDDRPWFAARAQRQPASLTDALGRDASGAVPTWYAFLIAYMGLAIIGGAAICGNRLGNFLAAAAALSLWALRKPLHSLCLRLFVAAAARPPSGKRTEGLARHFLRLICG